MNTTLRIIATAGATVSAPCLVASLLLAGAGPARLRPTIVELRQYTLHPGQRDVLIDLFEREFIESQEAHGMKVLGTFRDLDNPDRFVWIRGFPDMASRASALEAFYTGPAWQTHRQAANATMVDSDNVLLLHAARAGSELPTDTTARAPKGTATSPEGLVVATIYYFEQPPGPAFVEFFEKTVRPRLDAAGIAVRASYVTERSPNNFPRLPIREHEHAFVWISVFPNLARYEECLKGLSRSDGWSEVVLSMRQKLKGAPEILRLQPTPRSALHY
jgi:quinol monooxygenase YgiN